jgi:hypothetical protein
MGGSFAQSFFSFVFDLSQLRHLPHLCHLRHSRFWFSILQALCEVVGQPTGFVFLKK